MTRKTRPRMPVSTSIVTIVFCFPSCAALTASATVSDDPIRTAVLIAPSVMSSSLLASAKPWKYHIRKIM